MLTELLPKLEFRGLSDEDEDEANVGVPADLEDEDEDEDDDDDTAAPDVDDEVVPEEQ